MLKKIIDKKYSLLIIIIIITAFFRLYNLNITPPGLYPDEAMNGNNALETLSTGDFKVFYPENNGREGLFMNIQAIFLAIFGNYAWVLRLVSALFGILTVLGVYFLTKELFSKNIALLSAFLLSISFWHINFSRIGFRAIMAPFFLVWTIYFLILAYRKIREEHFSSLDPLSHRKFPLVAYSVLGGIFYGLGFYSYIAYRATPILLFFVFLFYLIKSHGFKKQIIVYTSYFLLATFLVALPIGIYFLHNPQDFFGRTTQISIFSSPNPIYELGINTVKTLAMFNFVGDWNWRHNFAGAPQLQWFIGILFLAGILIGLWEILRRRAYLAETATEVEQSYGGQVRKPEYRNQNLILLIWFAVAAMPVVISDEGLPHALRAILFIPPAFIFAGKGGIQIYEFIKSRIISLVSFKILNTACALVLILLMVQTYTAYFVSWGMNDNVQGAFDSEHARIGNELKALPNQLPKYVIVEAGGTDVRGFPMPTQTVMFLTDTFTPDKQNEKNLHYLLPGQESQILDPEKSYIVHIK